MKPVEALLSPLSLAVLLLTCGAALAVVGVWLLAGPAWATLAAAAPLLAAGGILARGAAA